MLLHLLATGNPAKVHLSANLSAILPALTTPLPGSAVLRCHESLEIILFVVFFLFKIGFNLFGFYDLCKKRSHDGIISHWNKFQQTVAITQNRAGT